MTTAGTARLRRFVAFWTRTEIMVALAMIVVGLTVRYFLN
jgi:hypothetical protein